MRRHTLQSIFEAAVSSKYIFNMHIISQRCGGDILSKNMTCQVIRSPTDGDVDLHLVNDIWLL